MNKKIKEYLDNNNLKFKDVDEYGNEVEMSLSEFIQTLIDRNKRLAELCNKYEEEHNTTFQTWLKDIDKKRKAIEYIKRHKQVYDVDGSKETKLDEFDILSSPKVLLDILEGDEDNETNNKKKRWD